MLNPEVDQFGHRAQLAELFSCTRIRFNFRGVRARIGYLLEAFVSSKGTLLLRRALSGGAAGRIVCISSPFAESTKSRQKSDLQEQFENHVSMESVGRDISAVNFTYENSGVSTDRKGDELTGMYSRDGSAGAGAIWNISTFNRMAPKSEVLQQAPVVVMLVDHGDYLNAAKRTEDGYYLGQQPLGKDSEVSQEKQLNVPLSDRERVGQIIDLMPPTPALGDDELADMLKTVKTRFSERRYTQAQQKLKSIQEIARAER